MPSMIKRKNTPYYPNNVIILINIYLSWNCSEFLNLFTRKSKSFRMSSNASNALCFKRPACSTVHEMEWNTENEIYLGRKCKVSVKCMKYKCKCTITLHFSHKPV